MDDKSRLIGYLFTFLILAIIALLHFIMEHLGLTIMIAIVIALVFVVSRLIFLRMFYNRDRRLSELNAFEYMDEVLTEAILKAAASGTSVRIGLQSDLLEEARIAKENMVCCKHTVMANQYLSAKNVDVSSKTKLGFSANTEPLVLSCINRRKRGYAFYVFAETIIVFAEGPERAVFLGAFRHEALTISCTALEYAWEPQIIQDRSQEPIRYYDRYAPVEDAIIISSYWEHENNSGSRNLRFNVENNPLHFLFKYGNLTLSFGSYSVSTAFSNFLAVEKFAELCGKI